MAWNYDLTEVNFIDYQTACDEIEAAIIERAKAIDRAVIYASIPARNKLEPTRKNNSWSEWAYDSIEALRDTAPGDNIFINYTDSSGDWDNQGGRAPKWTDAALLAKIGDSTIIDPSFGGAELAFYHWGSFIEQCYKILNELIWIRSNSSSGGWTEAGGGRKTYESSIGDSYATAQTDYNAESYRSGGQQARSYSEWENIFPTPDHIYDILRYRGNITNDTNTNSDLLNYDFDSYVVIKNDSSPNSVFSDPDYNTTEGNYAKTFSGSASTQKAIGEVGNLPTSTQPDPQPLGSNKRYLWIIGSGSYIIQKFNVLGGFVYV